jgi:hypothetical protein
MWCDWWSVQAGKSIWVTGLPTDGGTVLEFDAEAAESRRRERVQLAQEQAE